MIMMASLEEMEQIHQYQQPQQNQEDLQRLLESEQFKFSQMLLEDNLKDVPEGIPKKFWSFFDKEMAITNLTPEDVRWLMFQFDIAKLDQNMSRPDFELSFDDMRDQTNLKVKSFIKMKRSTSPMRERELLATQIKQFISNENEGVSGGFLSKLGGVFGGKK